MALVLKDRVRETTTTTGTGTVTLGGAVTGFQAFSVIGDANTCYYAIVGTTEWEVGLGTYTLSGTTLSRDTILESSNGGTAVSFSAGTKDVFVTYPAERAVLAELPQSWTGSQTFKEVTDTVYTITDGAAFEIDPANGSIQTVTLGANRTPAATNFDAGQVVLLGIDDGTAYTITWTTVAVTWVKAGGSASAPTLATSGFTWVLLWKVGSTIYGSIVGSP